MERSERRFRTENIIKKRWHRQAVQPMKDLVGWMYPTLEDAMLRLTYTPHHFWKYNGKCGCRTCKASRLRYKRKSIKQILIELGEKVIHR